MILLLYSATLEGRMIALTVGHRGGGGVARLAKRSSETNHIGRAPKQRKRYKQYFDMKCAYFWTLRTLAPWRYQKCGLDIARPGYSADLTDECYIRRIDVSFRAPMINAALPITVLMSVFNGQKYLREAIDSVLSQTFREFEFLIIDDGSSDNTLAILNEYAKADPRIRIVSRPNKGLTNTLNEGLDLARGEYLARMDADDVCMPFRLEKQLVYMQQHPDCVLVGSKVQLMDPEGLPIRQMATEQTHEEIDSAHLSRGWPVVHPATLMRMSALKQIGGYRDEFNTLEDLDLFLRLAEVGKLANLPDVLLRYRQHFASVTHSREQKQIAIRQAIYDQTRARRGLPPDSPPALNRFRDRHRYEQHQVWAWAALKAGNKRTARKHAIHTILRAPWAFNSWRLIVCAIRGR